MYRTTRYIECSFSQNYSKTGFKEINYPILFTITNGTQYLDRKIQILICPISNRFSGWKAQIKPMFKYLLLALKLTVVVNETISRAFICDYLVFHVIALILLFISSYLSNFRYTFLDFLNCYHISTYIYKDNQYYLSWQQWTGTSSTCI